MREHAASDLVGDGTTGSAVQLRDDDSHEVAGQNAARGQQPGPDGSVAATLERGICADLCLLSGVEAVLPASPVLPDRADKAASECDFAVHAGRCFDVSPLKSLHSPEIKPQLGRVRRRNLPRRALQADYAAPAARSPLCESDTVVVGDLTPRDIQESACSNCVPSAPRASPLATVVEASSQASSPAELRTSQSEPRIAHDPAEHSGPASVTPVTISGVSPSALMMYVFVVAFVWPVANTGRVFRNVSRCA
jgi:hypothetical protein